MTSLLWVASFLIFVGLALLYNQNTRLQSKIDLVDQENNTLERNLTEKETSLQHSNKILNTLRRKNISVVVLNGQAIALESYTKVFWDTSKNSPHRRQGAS